MKILINISILTLLLVMSFSACKPTEPEKPNTESGKNLVLKFNAMFDDKPLSWAGQSITGAGDTVSFDKIKFIMSNFTLETNDGKFITFPEFYGYLSLRTGRDSVILKNVPEGAYKSIRFMVGLDSATNHSDPNLRSIDHPLKPAVNDMHWGWAGGYIFNILEGYYQNNGATNGFSFHIANDVNVRNHSFVESFTIAKNSRIVFNVNADKYFDNVVKFSLKLDGNVSHSGDVDPIMDKFIKNIPGTISYESFQ
ncbi:MAG TPA: MbnP family protein [Bacteroidia bacterium]